MTTRRLERLSRMLQKEMGLIFLNEGKKLFGNIIISVTRVQISPDMGYAKFYLNYLNAEDQNRMTELIRFHQKELRMILAHRIKKQVRKIPEVSFFYDDSLDYFEKIDKIIKNIKNQDNKD